MPVKSAPGENEHDCEEKKCINNCIGSHFAIGSHNIYVS